MKSVLIISFMLLAFISLNPDLVNGSVLISQGTNPYTPVSDNVLLPNSNFRIFPGSFLQVETSTSTHPSDSARIVAAAITNYIEGGYTIGYYSSYNNGLDWIGTDHISDAFGNTIVTFGDPNINISGNGYYIITYIKPSPTGGSDSKVGISYSANSGAYWSPTVFIPGVDTADKPIAISDNVITSPYFGRTYVAYGELNFDQSRNKGIFFSYSSNGGVTWDISRRITNINPAFQDRIVGDMDIGSAGEVYVLWRTNRSYLGLSKSTNGGNDWIINNDIAINTDSSKLSTDFNSFYLQGVPELKVDRTVARNGWLYAVSLEKSADSMDIVFHRSTNGGSIWTHTRANQDATGTIKIQGMPALNLDRSGGINIFYYDTRNSPANDSFEIYLSRSVNGGNSFQDLKISDHKFKLGPAPVPLYGFPGYIGSYIGVTNTKEKIIPLWFDNSTGQYQAWTSSIEIYPRFEIKVIPEGFYNTLTQKLNMRDTLKVYLRSSTFPYAIIDSASGTLDSISFSASIQFRADLNSGSYYLVVRHRNSIETWSSNLVDYTFGSAVFYDFTTTPESAYGNNLKSIDGKWAIFSGDVNQDGFINLSDLIRVYNASVNFLTGYIPEDIDGNSIVNLSDILITYNNAQSFVRLMRP
ncbi:MAG: hypothetical protein ABI792_02830 [bacterium]